MFPSVIVRKFNTQSSHFHRNNKMKILRRMEIVPSVNLFNFRISEIYRDIYFKK